MEYTNAWLWYKPPKDVDNHNLIKKSEERAKSLYQTQEDFRSEAFRYFTMIDYKGYYKNDIGVKKDNITEEILLENPILTLNVTSSCIETVCNKISKVRPRVTFLTDDADRDHRELARKLDYWILKKFKKGKVWKEASKAFKSATVTGLGVIKVSIKNNKVVFKKIPIFDFFCNNFHIGSNEPEEAGERKNILIGNLIEMFPKREKEIKAEHGDQMDKGTFVYEIYREYKVHRIFTDKLMLVDEKWDKPLPYQLLKFEESDQGVMSVGVAKKLYAIQSAISYILGKTFKGVKNFAVQRVFLPKGSQPTESSISNLVGEIIEVNSKDGKVPQFSTPQATNPQVLDILLMLWQKAFEIIGVSQLSAGGAIPRGLENASGTALRNYQQVEGERFQLIRSDYEDAFISLAKLVIKLVPDSMLPKGISRAKIKEAKDNLSIWTSSLLPETPAGKLAMVGDLFNTGLVKGDQALSLMNSPDTNKFINSETSRLKAIDLILDRAVESGKKPNYYPALGLDLYLDRARKMFAELIVDEGEDSDKLDVLSSCIEELESKVSQQTGLDDALNKMAGGAVAGQPQVQEKPTQLGIINEGPVRQY